MSSLWAWSARNWSALAGVAHAGVMVYIASDVHEIAKSNAAWHAWQYDLEFCRARDRSSKVAVAAEEKAKEGVRIAEHDRQWNMIDAIAVRDTPSKVAAATEEKAKERLRIAEQDFAYHAMACAAAGGNRGPILPWNRLDLM